MVLLSLLLKNWLLQKGGMSGTEILGMSDANDVAGQLCTDQIAWSLVWGSVTMVLDSRPSVESSTATSKVEMLAHVQYCVFLGSYAQTMLQGALIAKYNPGESQHP